MNMLQRIAMIMLVGMMLVRSDYLYSQGDDSSLVTMTRSKPSNELGVFALAVPFRNVGIWYAHWWHDLLATSARIEVAPFGGHVGLIVRPISWAALTVEAGFTDYSRLNLHGPSYEPDVSIRVAPELRLSLGNGKRATLLSFKVGASWLYDDDYPSQQGKRLRNDYLASLGIGFGF